jgi:radical SAM family uncharacterized protein/radical SAM-linked protein
MIEKLLHGIEKPGRYFGNEFNAYHKDFSETRTRFVLAFPDLYEVGMSHLGLQLLYHTLNRMSGVLADRVFAPWVDFEQRLREYSEPLRGLESQRPIGEFDFVGFSLQYELSYTNLLTVLDLAGIPFHSADRTADHPWIIAGGPCAFNPEPLADFLDFVVLGEAEQLLGELVQVFTDWREARGSRQEFLAEVRNIPGIYVPAFFDISYQPDGTIAAIQPRYGDYRQVQKRLLLDLDADSPIPEKPLVPLLGIVHDRLSLEIARGCTRGCRFCQAGFIYRPVRERHPQRVLQGAEQALACSGFEDLTLLSLSSGDYSQIHELLGAFMERFAAQKVAVSLPSLRVGTLTPELMELIRSVRKTGFTLAPEAGSERLRRTINKPVLNDDLLTTARSAFQYGWRVLKLYFMMGLPTETRTDLDELVELCLEIWRLAGQQKHKPAVNISVSTFVPKPHTPFQWLGQIPLPVIQENLDYLRNRMNRRGLRLKWNEPGQSFLEAVFARGDRRLAATLLRAWELGARFDGWTEHFQEQLWMQAFQETGRDPHFYANRERGPAEILPWDHLSAGVTKEFLWKEYERALEEALTADCRWDHCSVCGICNHESIAPQLHREAVPVLSGTSAEPVAAHANTSYLYRVHYAKRGDIRFVGQLEVSRCFARAIRRAALPAAFSKGFHPHLKLSFGEALPLGMESEVEELHLTLAENIAPERVLEELNRQLPPGLTVQAVARVEKRLTKPSLHRVTYRIGELTPFLTHIVAQSWRKHLDEHITKKTKRQQTEVLLGKVLLDLRQLNDSTLEMDLCESPDLHFRPLAVLMHITREMQTPITGSRICKIAVTAFEEGDDVRRTHYQR